MTDSIYKNNVTNSDIIRNIISRSNSNGRSSSNTATTIRATDSNDDTIPLHIRFGRYVYLSAKNNCWQWVGAKNSSGYGVIRRGRQYHGHITAHRLSYELFYLQDIEKTLGKTYCICHRCDNPSCVNPHHLFLGTHQDNMNDMIRKGRHSPPPIHYGQNCSFAKLTENQVLQIRAMYKKGYEVKELARKFKISTKAIINIVKRKSWRHL